MALERKRFRFMSVPFSSAFALYVIPSLRMKSSKPPRDFTARLLQLSYPVCGESLFDKAAFLENPKNSWVDKFGYFHLSDQGVVVLNEALKVLQALDGRIEIDVQVFHQILIPRFCSPGTETGYQYLMKDL